jgi:pyrroloquinoline quinone biosynthesis protein E
LIAELSYKCPLKCTYCSNPIDFASYKDELTTDDWKRVFTQAAELGVMQAHLSGGEPLVRGDLVELVRHARSVELYTNLITGGTLLDRGRLGELVSSGLDHVQLSFQDADEEAADRIAGATGHAQKLEVGRWIKEAGLPLTVNVVLHRANIDRVPRIIAMAEELGADRLELANAQFYAWALENRSALLPSRSQCESAEATVRRERQRLAGKMEIAYVIADYFSTEPKPCMGGWAQSYMCIVPTGEVLPCHAARVIPDLRFESVRDAPLARIWRESEAMQRYRGDGWMKEPCKSCVRKSIDFGGCRCQAFLLAGDAASADPVCGYSPTHGVVAQAIEAAQHASGEPIYRTPRNSLRLARP